MITQNSLSALIQEGQFIGWTCQLDYEHAVVLTSDQWKARARGVPHNCFLLAAAGSGRRPGAEHRQARSSCCASPARRRCRWTTKRCRLKSGTSWSANFRLRTGPPDRFAGIPVWRLGLPDPGHVFLAGRALRLGSDIESYFQAPHLEVYRPTGAALEAIVNYVSPERAAAAREEARRLGLPGELPRFPIGTVRYTSTDRLHRGGDCAPAVFHLNAVDFLARRTAVFGMTRTGKSNTVKQLVSVVMRTSRGSGLKIGQLIYDLNGEYANANQQDQGSIAEVFPADTLRYRMLPTPGFQLILNNFFTQIVEGHTTLKGLIEATRSIAPPIWRRS